MEAEQSKLDRFFSRLAPKRQRVEDSADSLDSENVFRLDILEENDTDTHCITDENVEESLCSGNTSSSIRRVSTSSLSSTSDSVHTDVVIVDQPR